MAEPRKLTIVEQVEIIQRVLKDPRYFDDEQNIEAGIKKKPVEKEVKFDE